MKILKKLLKYFGLFVGLIVVWAIVATLCSYVTINGETNDKPEIPIYILTNGVHTDIVMPSKSNNKDWTKVIPYENTVSKDSTANWLSMGWGDKGFYLETPTWADLKFSTAFKAAFSLSESAIHCTYYKNMKEGQDCKKVMISQENYTKLIDYIQDSFDFQNKKTVHIPTHMVYGKNDAFYEAKGSYSLFYTCNSWSNNALKAAQQKAALHTLTDTGIFRHYSK